MRNTLRTSEMTILTFDNETTKFAEKKKELKLFESSNYSKLFWKTNEPAVADYRVISTLNVSARAFAGADD